MKNFACKQLQNFSMNEMHGTTHDILVWYWTSMFSFLFLFISFLTLVSFPSSDHSINVVRCERKKNILMFFATGFLFPSLIHDIDELVTIWIDFFHVFFCICVNILWRLFSKASQVIQYEMYIMYTPLSPICLLEHYVDVLYFQFSAPTPIKFFSSAFLDFFFADEQ